MTYVAGLQVMENQKHLFHNGCILFPEALAISIDFTVKKSGHALPLLLHKFIRGNTEAVVRCTPSMRSVRGAHV